MAWLRTRCVKSGGQSDQMKSCSVALHIQLPGSHEFETERRDPASARMPTNIGKRDQIACFAKKSVSFASSCLHSGTPHCYIRLAPCFNGPPRMQFCGLILSIRLESLRFCLASIFTLVVQDSLS